MTRININGYKIEPGADLKGADLSNANLSNADLSNADLSEANLSEAKLRCANLWRANLRGAKGIESCKGISKEFLIAANKVGMLIYEVETPKEELHRLIEEYVGKQQLSALISYLDELQQLENN